MVNTYDGPSLEIDDYDGRFVLTHPEMSKTLIREFVCCGSLTSGQLFPCCLKVFFPNYCANSPKGVHSWILILQLHGV